MNTPTIAQTCSLLSTALQQKSVLFVDVDTQYGFFEKKHRWYQGQQLRDGIPVPDGKKLYPNFKKLNALISTYRLPRLATQQTHPDFIHLVQQRAYYNDELNTDGLCVPGTRSHQKLKQTALDNLLPKLELLLYEKINELPSVSKWKQLIQSGVQILFQKNRQNIEQISTFEKDGIGYQERTEENLLAFKLFQRLKQTGVQVAVVYGVAQDICVQFMVTFLKKMGITPIVISDATKPVGKDLLNKPAGTPFEGVATLTSKEVERVVEQALTVPQ